MNGPSCGATVLHAAGRRLTKVWHADGSCTAYDKALLFDLHPVELANLDALLSLLRELELQPEKSITRGAIADPSRTRGVRRLLHRDPATGEEPTLRDVPRRWCALDVDGLSLPSAVDPGDLAAVARAVEPRLPRPFQGARRIVQATASHGITAGARLRLWFWLDRPTSGTELRRWFAAMGGHCVDVSCFNAAQIIYTAAPLFEGRADPIPQRLELLDGRDVVRVPPPELLAPPPLSPPRPVRRDAQGGERALAWAEREIARQREGARHATALCVAGWPVKLARAGEVGGADVTATTVAGVTAAGKHRAEGEAIASYVLRKERLA